jgi:hypothetical protein
LGALGFQIDVATGFAGGLDPTTLGLGGDVVGLAGATDDFAGGAVG